MKASGGQVVCVHYREWAVGELRQKEEALQVKLG
jgi:hypothetical protein